MSAKGTLVRLLLASAVALTQLTTAQEDGSTVTFYGSHQRVSIRNRDSELEVSFTFKTPYNSGLLALVRREDTRGYLAIGLVRGQLLAVLQGPEAADVIDAGAVVPEATHRVDVNVHGTLLNVSLDYITVSSLLSSPVTFKDVYFGGVYSLFAPIFRTLNITEFFVGCMTDTYVNGRAVEFEESYGQRLGCCPNPTRVSWCFTSNSSFSLRTGLQHERFSEQLVISFLLKAEGDMGMVLLSHTQSNMVAVELYEGTLYLHVNSLVVRCPGSVSDGSWHSLEMAISLSALTCRLDGAVNSTFASRRTIPSLSSPYYVGMATVQSDLATHGLNLRPMNIGTQSVFPSFLGCLKRFQFSGIDLVPSEVNEVSPNVSEPCLPVTEPPLPTTTPTTPTPLTVENCPILAYRGLLGDVVLETRNLTVKEGSKGILTPSTLHFPTLQALQEEVRMALESTIVFHVVREPVDGVLARVLGSRTSSFSYQEVKSRDIIYRHSGAERKSDSVTLEAAFECNGQEVNSTAPSVLSFEIELINDPPSIRRQKELTIAVGTRRVITSDVITMTDADSSGPDKINFHVESIDTCHQCCQECVQEKAGRIERAKAPGIEHVFFTQEDVNDRDIAFQHFASFGTATVRIYLTVTDENAGSTSIDITVNPHEGHINLTANACLFVVEGTAEILKPRHLNAITDFEDQNTTLTYDVIQPVSHGRLEKKWQVQPHNVSTWLPIDESEHDSSFTKEDVMSGYVRYVHDSRESTATSDGFQFQVRSTSLIGPEGDFCIRVIPYKDLQQPNLVVDTGTMVVPEGGTIVIDEAVLRTSLSPPILIDWLQESIGIEQLGIVFVIPPSSHGPLSGELMVDGLPLHSDSFSLVKLLEGGVTYAHNGSEVHSDSFDFYAEARTTHGLPIRPPQPTANLSVSISVIPVNDHAPEIYQEVVIAPSEGGWITISPEMLRVTDEDLPGDEVIIYIRKKGLEHPTGTFVFSNNKNVEVRSFTMQDIYEERLLFEHTLNSSAPLGYLQYLRVEDGNHTTRGSVAVEAVPLTLNVSTNPISACLDATSSQRTLTLSPDLVQVVLQDKDGSDPNQLSSIEIVVVRQPEYGVLQLSNDKEVAQFSYSDLENAKIVYNFTNHVADTTVDSFELEFNYGHASSGPTEFEVCINPVPLPRLERNKEIRLSAGGVNTITTANMLASDNRGSPLSSLEYVVLSPPNYGVLFDELAGDITQHLSSFTQQDISDGRIAYNHREVESNSVSDWFEFKVCTEHACTQPQNFTIRIYLAKLIVTNVGFTVDENGNRSITPSMLTVRAPDGYGQVDILIPRGKGPKNGILKLHFSEVISPVTHFTNVNIGHRLLFYEHDGSETKHDNFEFIAQAIRDPNSNVVLPPDAPSEDRLEFKGVVNITIRPINDNAPLKYNLTKHMAVVEGGVLQITDHYLSYHDIDSDANDNLLAYQLLFEALHYGNLFLEGSQDPVIRWTEEDLRRGRLFYQHKNKVPPDEDDQEVLFFEVSDGLNKAREFVYIHIKPVLLVFSGQRPYTFPYLRILEGEIGDISHRNLKYVAANANSLTDADYVYSVTQGPRHGNLSFNGSVAEEFTQRELLNTSLIYKHDGSNTREDSFTFTITVPPHQYVSEDHTFVIVIGAVDDDPPVVYIQDPLFVVEWSNLTIDRTTLDIRDQDSTTEEKWVKVECTVIEPPRFGAIQRTELGGDYMNTSLFTLFNLARRSVQYNHMKISRGLWSDRFVFTVTDGINPQNQSYPVNIIILPHTLELNVSALRVRVRENSAVQLSPENFQVLHPYLQEVPGKISISAPPEHGSIVFNGTSSPVSEFQVEHLQSGLVSYQQDGNEIVEDGFNFTYENLLPRGYERRTIPLRFVVEVLPVNDQPPSLITHNLFVWMGERVVLGASYLNATDLDTHPKQLMYSYIPFVMGHVEYADAVGHPIFNFSQDDVDAGRVIFVHDSGLSANVTFTVTDGVYVTHGYILVSAQPLMLIGGTNSGLRVSLGGVVSITQDNLDFNTNDHNDINSPVPRPIYYQMASALYGKVVVVDSVQVTNFTQMDVNEGRVSYVHTAVDIWEPRDTLCVRVWTPLADPQDLRVEVDIELPQNPTSDLAVNELVQVREGGHFCLDEHILDARNLKYRTWTHYGRIAPLDQLVIEYNVTALPPNGSLEIGGAQRTDLPVSFTQSELSNSSVCYRHDDSESRSDGFPFEVKIKIETTPLDTFFGFVNISINLQNDEIPQLVPSLPLNRTFVEGFTVSLGPTDLEVTDKDTHPEDLEYIVRGLPDNGDLIVWNEPIEPRERFSQRDVNTGRVKFRAYPGANSTSSFVFTYSDGNFQANEDMIFRITVVPLVLSLVESAGLAYRQDKLGAEVTSEVVNTVTNGNREETSFVIRREPSNGQLKRGDHTLHIEDFFTQEEVDARRIRYLATDLAASNDSFTVDIHNRDLVVPYVTIPVHVGVWGQVRDDVIMDLGTGSSGPLPGDLLELNGLKARAKERLRISVHTSPRYGHLEMNFNGNAAKRSAPNGLLSFHYDDLQNGWVHYHWDSGEVNSSLTSIPDSFTLMVYGGIAMQPGEATVHLAVIPPSSTASPPTTESTTTDPSDSPSPNTPTTPTEESGFPMYALVPILGVFVILLVIIVVVIVFCLSQQKRIRRKWGPKPSATTTHPYPWSVQPSLPPPVTHHHYDFDPTSGGVSIHGDLSHADEFSQYSEDATTRHSPSPSGHRCSPLHRNPPLPRPRIASGRSNVSISVSHRSLSSRQSDISEVSSYMPHMHLRPLHHQVHRPIPIRPMVHSPIRRNGSRDGTESGYLSPIRSLDQSMSSLPRPQGTGGSVNDTPSGATSGVDTLNSDNDSANVSQSNLYAPLAPTESSPPPSTTTISVTVADSASNSPVAACPSDANTPSGCDPELMKLFRSSNPILKKQEYWV